MERGDEPRYGGWWMTPEEEAELERLRKQRNRDQEAFNRDIWERGERIKTLIHGPKP